MIGERAKPKAKAGLAEAQYVRFRDLVRAKSGLALPAARRRELERAVAQALLETGASGPDALYSMLADGDRARPALETLIAAITVGETHFFRDRAQFEALGRHVLPDLIARRRAERSLRLWSVGCASGEEPHSLAILLERLLPDLDDWNVLILATDIDPSALEKARRGVYGRWSFREVPQGIEEAYFLPRDRGLEILPRIRRRVTLGYLNLVEDVYPSLHTNTRAMDLILCRNVLMYFEEPTARQVVSRLHAALAQGGWLVVSPAELSQSLFERFTARNFPHAVLYQKVGGEGARALEALGPARALPAEAPFEQAGDHGEALPRLEAAAPAGEDGRAACLAGRVHADAGELAAAQRWVGDALDQAPMLAEAHYLQGLIRQEEGRLEEALTALRRCVYADPQFVLGHFALAGLAWRLGLTGRARKALEAAARLLSGRRSEEPIPEGDGLTVGQLLELVAVHEALLEASLPEEAARA